MRYLLLAVTCSLLLAAQQNTPATTTAPHFTVRGRAMNTQTGEPVRGALIMLNGPEQHSAFSGSDGQFEIDGVPAGTFVIMAQRPGYSGSMVRNQHPQTVSVSDNVDGVVVKMPPQARISGTVRDSDGEAVEGLQVTLMQKVIVNGRKTWQRSGGSATTDEGGVFVIDDLAPGAYVMSTMQKPVYPGAPPKSEGSRLTYAAQYFPNASDMASAQIIDVNPGDDLHYDISVAMLRGVRVTFAVDPPSQFVFGTLVGQGGETIRTPFQRDNKTGKFTAASVPPGAWKLIVNSQGGRGAAAGSSNSGEVEINVGSTDLDNVVVTLGPGMEIPVNIVGGDPPAADNAAVPHQGRLQAVTPMNGPLPPARSVYIQLLPAAEAEVMVPGVARPMTRNEQDGMKIENVTPGAYRVLVRQFSQTNCLESLTSGSVDLMRDNLVVTAGTAPQPINVNLQSNCAELDVTANTKSMATLLILPDAHAIDPIMYPLSPNSTATVKNLSAGDYMVYAVSDVNGLEYANPEAMKNFSGQRVSLSAGQKTTLTLDVNDREGK